MSESEEMYLISIAQLNESGTPSPVPVSVLADALEVQSVSVNQMVHKMHSEGLVTYTPYKGVSLTPEGQQAAMQVLRKRRMWEVFLFEYLHLPAVDAEVIACQLEHILNKEVSERLALFLGNPQLSPQNKPIPDAGGQVANESDMPLSSISTGDSGEITRITAMSAARSFLRKQGFTLQTRLSVLAVASDGERLVTSEEGVTLHLSSELCETIWIKHQ